MTKLERLNKKQQALMSQVRDEWIQNAFTYEPITEKDIKIGVEWIYAKIGKKTPPIFIFESYWGKQLGYNILKGMRGDSIWASVSASVWASVMASVRDSVWASVMASVRTSVSDSVWTSVRTSVRTSVGTSVRTSVMASVWDSVWDSVWTSVSTSVMDSVWDSVWTSVRDSVSTPVWTSVSTSVMDSVWDSVMDSVKDSVRNKLEFTEQYYGAGYDSGWLAFYDYFARIGILENKEYETYRDLMKKVWSIDFFEGVCLVCIKPVTVLKQNGRLHALGEPAVQWADGSGNWFIDGVAFDVPFFSKEYGKLPTAIANKTITAQEVLKLKNIEQRQTALKYLGPEKLLSELDAKLIDQSKRGNQLYAIAGLSREPNRVMKLLKYRDPSTDRVYVSCVPDTMQKADEAMAWKFYLTEEQYEMLEVEA